MVISRTQFHIFFGATSQLPNSTITATRYAGVRFYPIAIVKSTRCRLVSVIVRACFVMISMMTDLIPVMSLFEAYFSENTLALLVTSISPLLCMPDISSFYIFFIYPPPPPPHPFPNRPGTHGP